MPCCPELQASDESNATTNKRLEAVGVEGSEDTRRAWRQLLYTAPGLGQYISGEARRQGGIVHFWRPKGLG